MAELNAQVPDPQEQARAARREAIARALAESAPPEPQDDPGAAAPPRSRGFWGALKENLSSLGEFDPTQPLGVRAKADVGRAVLRGLTSLADEVVEFAVEDVGGNLLKSPITGTPGTMTFSELFGEQEKQRFDEWYENRSHTETALFGDDFREKHLPYDNETLALNLVETTTKFVAGMTLLGGAATEGAFITRLGINMAKGAIIDATAFDPHQERLADMVQAFGIENEYLAYLAADENDSNELGRLKSAMEGLIIGGTLDLVIEGGLRASKVFARLKAKKITEAEARAQLAAIDPPKVKDGPVHPVTGADGTPHLAVETGQPVAPKEFITSEVGENALVARNVKGSRNYQVTSSVTPEEFQRQGYASANYEKLALEIEGQGGKLISDKTRSADAEALWKNFVAKGRATYDEATDLYTYKPSEQITSPEIEAALGDPVVPMTSAADAQMEAAALNAAIRRERGPVGESLRQVQEWRTASATLAESADLDDLLSRQAQIAETMPLGYIRDTRDMVASAEALSEMMPVQLLGKGGRTIGHDAVLRQTAELFGRPDMDVEAVRRWAAETFGTTENLPARLLGFRQVLMGHAFNLRQAAKTLAYAPNDPYLARKVAESWEALVDLGGNVSGSASNVARTLEQQKIPVGTLAGVPKGFEKQAELLAEFKSARRLFQQASAAGQTDAARAALERVDRLGEQLGGFTGGRPKNKAGLAGMFDKDAQRAAQAAQPELPIGDLPPKPSVRQDVPGALAWHEQAARKLEAEMDAARKAAAEAAPEINPSEAFEGLKGMSKEDIVALSRVLAVSDESGVEVIMRTIQQSARMTKRHGVPKGHFVRSLYISMLLSNPLTHARNIISNTMMANLQGVERIWAGAAPRRWFGRSSYSAAEQLRLRQEGYDFLRFYWSSLGDGWQAGRKAWKLGENVMDPGAMRGDLQKLPTIGEDISAAAAIIRPSNINRLMISADEVAQQMAYRAHTKAKAMRAARESRLNAADTADLLERTERLAFNEKGQATLPEGLDFSRYVTFKTALTDTPVGQGLASMAENPVLRATVLPFVRTPVNLWSRSVEHVPLLANVSKRFRDDIAAGGARAELARARTELGGAAIATATTLVLTGQLRGGGPADPDLREQQRRMGIPQYSVRIPGTDSWVKFDLLDPVMTPIALAADAVMAAESLIQDGHERDLVDFMTSLMAVTAERLSDRAYWGRLTDVMAALTSGNPNKVQRVLGLLASGYIPAIGRGLSGDQLERQVWTFWDRLKSRVPGLDRSLEAKRNIVGHKVMRAPMWGFQQQNPFQVSFQIKDHAAWDRLMVMGDAFSMPNPIIRAQWTDEKIDLSERGTWANEKTPKSLRDQSPYDRWIELSGQLRLIRGQTLEEALIELANSKEFIADVDAGRKRKVFEDAALIISLYQDAAKAQMFKEYPAVLVAYQKTAASGIAERLLGPQKK